MPFLMHVAHDWYGPASSKRRGCGGIAGYYNLLQILSNPRDPEHESVKEWLNYDFDPARFNLDLANGILRRLKA